MKFVYHSSEVQGIKVFIPTKSTHGVEWVYATRERNISCLFISGLGGDFTCQVGRDRETGKPYVCERFHGAFDLRYENKKGSIYTLLGDYFKENMTGWDEEVVCDRTVYPCYEEKVSEARRFLLELYRNNKLIIKYFPEKINGIPPNNEDLVKKAVIWTRIHGDRVLKKVDRYHPGLLDRVERGLREGWYR